MGDLDIEIKVAVGNTIAELTRVDAATRKADAAFTGFASTFARIAAAQKREADELTRVRLEALSTTKAFAGLTEQFDREAKMLDRIHGPAKRLAEDLQALDMLHRKGMISAAEYTEQLEKMGQVHGPSKGDAGESVAAGIGGQLAAIASSGAGAAAALGLITQAFDDWKARKADVRDATNSILKFYADIDGAKAAMAEQIKLSEDLGLNVRSTAHAYAAVREATEDLGISSKQMTDITRNLTAALIVDGGSIEGVSAVMQRLQYANEAGILSARELKSIWQQSPEVVHSFEASLGKTYPELVKMAKEGKLTGAVLETMTKGLGDGHEAVDKYRQRLLSVNQVMEENHVSYFKAITIIGEMKQAYEEVGETAGQAFQRIVAETVHSIDVSQQLVDKLQLIMALARVEGGFATTKNIIKDGVEAQQIIDSLKTPWEQYNDRVKETRRQLEQTGMTAAEVARQLARVPMPEGKKAPQGMQGAFPWGEADAISGGGSTTPWDRRGPYNHEVSGSDMKAPDYGSTWEDTVREMEANSKKLEKLAEDSREKIIADWATSTQKQIDAVAEHTKPLEDALVELALTGETSWRKMADAMIADLARVAAQKAILGIINLVATGSTSSPAEQAAAAMNGGGHAFGGSYITPGVGGQDSVPVMFRLTPGERVDFTPPGGYGPGGGNQRSSAPAPARPIIIEDRRDSRALMQGGPDVDRVILDSLHRHGFRRN